MRHLLLLAIAAVGCSGGADPCDGGPVQVLQPLPGEEFRYVNLACDGVTPRLKCAKMSGANEVVCTGDRSPICCSSHLTPRSE